MKIQCEVCEKAEAEVLCCSDEAALCKPCDIKVHEANKLFQRHHRVPLQKPSSTTSSTAPLCDICKERKGYFFCLDDRALLCNDCDGAIHICNSHQRFLLSGVQASDQSLTKSPGCSTNLSSETYQIQSKASLNSQYSSEENEAGNSGETDKTPSVILSP
ncbi:hypothetical protein BRARA_I02526 [Brassica rapa]|uniref:B box-type domain-containing protein n=1 Tax=Brassica campestris TaxID=3711 RepID=A0A397XWU6_BRACM|nr:hypothetical protein BRARA_I02526 [Brassica rapa]